MIFTAGMTSKIVKFVKHEQEIYNVYYLHITHVVPSDEDNFTVNIELSKNQQFHIAKCKMFLIYQINLVLNYINLNKIFNCIREA